MQLQRQGIKFCDEKKTPVSETIHINFLLSKNIHLNVTCCKEL